MPFDGPGRFEALEVANYFVGKALSEKGRHLTNMGLQKVLYFADGEYLAANRRPLFDASIEAWDYGPVVPTVYHEFKRFGSGEISEKANSVLLGDDLRSWRSWTPEVPLSRETDPDRKLLDDVWKRYGRRSAVNLMQESHRRDGPWYQAYTPGSRHVEISRQAMFDFFSRQ